MNLGKMIHIGISHFNSLTFCSTFITLFFAFICPLIYLWLVSEFIRLVYNVN
jgi:hypothetical protein